MIVIILMVIMIKAKIPNGCAWKEADRSPWKKSETELPNPQPGQKSIPRFAKGQTVKWIDWGSLINTR